LIELTLVAALADVILLQSGIAAVSGGKFWVGVLSNIGVALHAGITELTMDGVLMCFGGNVQVYYVPVFKLHGITGLSMAFQANIITDGQIPVRIRHGILTGRGRGFCILQGR
jgi:hypothetical protein